MNNVPTGCIDKLFTKALSKTDTMNNRSHDSRITSVLSVEITTKMSDTYIYFHKVRRKQDRSIKPHT